VVATSSIPSGRWFQAGSRNNGVHTKCAIVSGHGFHQSRPPLYPRTVIPLWPAQLPPYGSVRQPDPEHRRNNRVPTPMTIALSWLSVTPEGAYDFAVVVPDIHIKA